MTSTRRIMLWMWVAVVVVAGAGTVPTGRDGRSLTWAQVARDDNTDHEFTEYDDSFFRNHDYEYVDDAQAVELSPPSGAGASPPRAERRTLGSLLGRLVPDEHYHHHAPASLLPRVHGANHRQPGGGGPQGVVQVPHPHKHPLRHHHHHHAPPRPTPAAAAGDLVVVSDESGRQHVVTINDIVSSLAQLDEQTITDLLLGPSNTAQPTQPVQLPARPSVSIPIGLDLSKAFTQSRLSSQTQARTPTSSNSSPLNPNPTKTTSNLSPIRPDTSPSHSPTNHTLSPVIPNVAPTNPNRGNTNLNSSPTTSNRSPITSNLSPTSSVRNPTSSNRNPTTSNLRPISFHQSPTTSSLSPTTSHRSPSRSSGRSPTGSSQSPHQTPTSANHSPLNPSSNGPRRRPSLSPTHTPDQSPVRGTNTRTRSRTSHPAHAPPRTHTSTRVSTSSVVRAIPNHASTHTSSPGVVRAVSTRLPSQSVVRGNPTTSPTRTPAQAMVRGTPFQTPARSSTFIPDFIVPSPSESTQNAVRRSSQGVQRPVRHTGPVQEAAAVPEEDGEVIVVRDETGAMHVVTIQDIVSSLASLNPTEAKGLLFGKTPAAPPAATPFASHNLLQNTGHAVSGVTAGHDPQRVTLGSLGVQVGGPVVKTDSAGTVHALPQRGGLFTIQDIIAAAEAEEGPQVPRPATPSQLVQVYPNRHHNVLAPKTTTPPSLMDALRQQDLPEPLVQYLAAPSVTQPVTKATPAPQPAPQGLGATISGLFSRIVGGQQQQQQQPQQQLAQQSQAVVNHAGLALPTPIHFREGAKQSTNTVQGPTKPAQDDFLPPALSHLSQAVQDALRRQADDVPNFVPASAQPQAAARADTGPVEFVSAEEEDEPLHTAPQEQVPVILPPNVLEKVPPPVLRRVTKQYLESQVGGQTTAEERISKKRKKKPHYQYVELHQPVLHSFPPPIPAYPPPVPAHPAPVYPHLGYPDHHHQGYGEDDHSGYGDAFPMLDIFLLADVTKVKKVGDSNLSVKAPKIGDPSYFVDTRPHHGYHGHH
ncbi:mucin-5AC-like [Portunus trituberculatus]|uniref:mucin-5AC-like n=1 Tax=Portunus trituberculatus TaxID=210409 RepID=UPI001E1CECB2|nr:mucin-5AC-like [Portunus trituberculatus]